MARREHPHWSFSNSCLLIFGISAIKGVTDASGVSIFSGKEATGFSNEEEEIIKMVKVSLSAAALNKCKVLIGG